MKFILGLLVHSIGLWSFSVQLIIPRIFFFKWPEKNKKLTVLVLVEIKSIDTKIIHPPQITLALIMSGVSLLAPHWRSGRGLIDHPVHGLYYYCDNLNTHCLRYEGGVQPVGSDEWLKVVQVFYPVAVFLALLSAIATWIYVVRRFKGAKAGWNILNFILLTSVLAGLIAALLNIAYMCEVHVSSVGFELDFCFYFNWAILPMLVVGALLVRASHGGYGNIDVSVGQFDMQAILNYGRGETLILLGSIMATAALAMSAVALVSPFWQTPVPGFLGGSDIGLFYRVDPGSDYTFLESSLNPWHIACQVYYSLSAFLVLVSAAATVKYALLRVDSSPVGENIVNTACYSAVTAALLDIFVTIAYKFEVFAYAPNRELDFCWYFNLAIIPLLVLAAAAVRASYMIYESKSADATSGMPALPYDQEYLIALRVPMLAIGAGMSIVSWFAPYWMVGTGINDKKDGLYYYCSDDGCGNINNPSTGGNDDWWRVAQVFYPFSSVFALIAIICLVMYIMKRNVCDQVNQTLAHGIFVATLLSAVFALLATVSYSENVFVPGNAFKLGFAFYFNYGIIPLLVFGGIFIRESRCGFKSNAVAPAPGVVVSVSEAMEHIAESITSIPGAAASGAAALTGAAADGAARAAGAVVDTVESAVGAAVDGAHSAGHAVADALSSEISAPNEEVTEV